MDMENVCRTCLRSPDKLCQLDDYVDLTYKIETISSIQLSDNDNYPSTICEECINNVNKLYNFRKVIINNDKEIRERYATLQRTKLNCKARRKRKQPKTITEKHSFVKIEAVKQPDDAFSDDFLENIDTVESDNDSDFAESREMLELNSLKRAIATGKICKCNICNKTFTSRFKLYNHRRSEHIAPGICNICGIAVRADNLKRHVQLHSEGPVACKDCGKVFKNSESLRGHLLIHKGVTFTCEVCGKSSKVKSEHGRHMKTHIDPEFRKKMCRLCGKKVRDIKSHMHSHTGERPHLCLHCSKGFTSSYGLKIHIRQHTNEKPYICEFCSIAYTQKVSLSTHIKTKHKNEIKKCNASEYPELGKIMCTICGKKVRDLKKHMHSHTGERPYLCSYCSKGFTSTYALKVHTRQHTNEKPYICEYCPMAFTQKVSLSTHIKSKHNIEITNCNDVK